jgi:adenylate cyclase
MQARRTRTWVRLGISLVVLGFFGAHSSGWFPVPLLSQAERYAYDARVVLTLPGTVNPELVIIDLDEKSLAAEGHWPWPRDKLAKLVEQLFERYHIGVLGLDFVFPEADRTPGLELLDRLGDLPGARRELEEFRRRADTDGQFAAALAKYPVVTGLIMLPTKDRKGALPPPVLDREAATSYGIGFVEAAGYIGNLERLQAGAIGGGFFDNPTLDADGVFRRIPLMQIFDGQVYPSLALAVTRRVLGNPPVGFVFDPPDAMNSLNLEALRLGRMRVPVDGEVTVMVPYRGQQGSFPYISATDVLAGKADPAMLKPGVIALFGSSAGGIFDLRVTPFSRAYAGVEIHANLIAGILDRSVKHKPAYYLGAELLLEMVVALIMTLLFPRLSPLGGAALTIALLVGVLAMAFGLWQYSNFIMPMGVPILYVLSLFLAQTMYGYFIESRRARNITRQFGEYVPPEVVAEMAENPQNVSMEGESREMTVLFSDVRGFTTISEGLEAKELTELMNEFLTPLTKVIQKHRGTIDKYMGDAIMAFWGAPLPDPQHAFHALQAGMEMLRAVRELDEPFAKRGWQPLNIGVGLNTGIMRVGNMGSEFRRAYTVMGDPVNTGSRLEGLTKKYGVSIIISESTRGAVPEDWVCRELDLVRVKGKNKPVAIYEPLGPKSELDESVKQELLRHRAAFRAYRAQQWDEAEREFFGLSQSGNPLKVYEVFLHRIPILRENPPPPDWDGAFTFDEK